MGLNIKHTLMVEPCSISLLYITKQLEYVTNDDMDHIHNKA